MKILVLGDIHGLGCWESIIENDKFIIKKYGT
jgi:hypothetical protein